MHRLALVLLVVVVVVAAAAAQRSAPRAGATDLRIAYRASADARAVVRTLRCDPARGTVANPAQACRRLRALGAEPFAPTPRDRACTQIVGGPMTVLVTGTYRGGRVWTRLALTDGCAIARWNALAFLFPSKRSTTPGGAPGG